VVYLIEPIERYLRRRLTERNRNRFDRAKRFVESIKRGGDAAAAHRANARWLKFLCRHPAVQRDIWPQDADFLRHFAIVFGLSARETRKFIGLSLFGRLWRAWGFDGLVGGPPEFVARLTRVKGSKHFDDNRRDGTGLILLPMHGLFSRLFQPYLRHGGHDGLELGLTNDRLEQRGFDTPGAKRLELARQMHAARHALDRGGIVFNAPDARQNLDNSRPVDFFGRQRRLAAGFAELALRTNAQLMPVAYRFSPRGFFVLEFGPPFSVPEPPSADEERIDSLVAQYAHFLRDEWRRYPWNLQWSHLQYYCLLPEVDSGARGERAGKPPSMEPRYGGVDEEFA
jgi:lauroyl/myristoyl acyltransferase